MILQEEEKHNTADLSSNNTQQREQDSLPACSVSEAGQPALVAGCGMGGFTACDIEELDEVEDDTPRLVTRGPHPTIDDTPHPIPPQKTKIDTLTFTAEEPFTIMQELLVLSGGPDITFIPRKAGTNGYRRGFDIVLYAQTLGTLSYGSEYNQHQDIRPCIHIEGSGKTDKFNWQIFYYYAKLLTRPKVTRGDIALDLFKGELTIEETIQAHLDLKFKSPKANKNPKITPFGTIQPDGTNPGRTLYIGSMQSSKFIRVYEKSFQIYRNELESNEEKHDLIKSIFRKDEKVTFEGYNNNEPIQLSKWLRVELQLRDGNCVLPLDILVETDKYFAGSYPFCEELLNMTDGKKPPRMLTDTEMEFDVRALNHKAISGSFIEDCIYMGMSDSDIVKLLRSGKGPSQKLIRSGALKDEFRKV